MVSPPLSPPPHHPNFFFNSYFFFCFVLSFDLFIRDSESKKIKILDCCRCASFTTFKYACYVLTVQLRNPCYCWKLASRKVNATDTFCVCVSHLGLSQGFEHLTAGWRLHSSGWCEHSLGFWQVTRSCCCGTESSPLTLWKFFQVSRHCVSCQFLSPVKEKKAWVRVIISLLLIHPPKAKNDILQFSMTLKVSSVSNFAWW